jgi:hypothetical protein
MLVRRAVMQYVGGYFYQIGRGVLRLVPGEVMQGMAGYVRQVGKGVPNLVRCAVMRDMGGYLYQMGRAVLGLVRRAVAFLQFEDGWDAAGYICLSFGLALMLLGTLAAPDLPALSLLADELAAGPCNTNECTTFACNPQAQGPDCRAPYLACKENLKDLCGGCKCVLDTADVCACYASPPVATE